MAALSSGITRTKHCRAKLLRVVLTGAWTELEVGRSGKKILWDGGLPLLSLWRPGNHAPLTEREGGDSVHALWLHCVHARVGRCEHTGVALGLHLPVCVYVRGIHRGPFDGDGERATVGVLP